MSSTSNSGAGKTVLVTGGSGYVAAEVLNAFLKRGYKVRTTVRNEASANKIRKSHSKYLAQLSFAIVTDLETPGGFDEAVKGVDGVIHTASPFVLSVEDNERDLLKPAINGTLEVLKSVQQHNPDVKRIVITSSFASVVDVFQGGRPGYTYTEADWNPTTYEIAAKKDTPGEVSYCASKTFAEKAAFDFVNDNKPNFDVTTICPPMVYGPSSAYLPDLKHLNTSSADIYRFTNGSEKTVPDTAFFAFVDVRDLGEAHVRAYELPEAARQRYLCAASGYTYQQVADIVRKDFPERRDLCPEGTPNAPFPDVYKLDTSKIKKELRMEFRSLQDSIHDMVEQFIEVEKKA
ncbi:putative cinnamoyl-CoA reductase [Tricladium varicosporioides]|nr:putative cinnamoyl-CoA reductase [Hymenoscyphus varicosporioides]